MSGSAVLTLFALRAGKKEYDTALDLASAGAAVLTVSSGATGFLTFLSSFNPQVSLGAEFGQQLGRFLLETELGRVWLITTVAAATITVLAYAFRRWGAAALIGVFSLMSLVPMATQGHSGSLANHDAAVMALVLHIIGAAVWLGGLVTLVFLRSCMQETRMRVIVERYSTLALVAFIVVFVSGIARALTSITDWGDLISAYGAVLALKVLALAALGALGTAHRRRFIRRGVGERGAFWAFIAVEFAVMGLASGAATALARTPAPADTSAPPLTTPAEILTEAPLPAELTAERWFVSWDIDLLWILIAGFGIFFYLVGVRRLRRRGELWPASRTLSWVAGMLLLVWVSSGPISVYADYLHSVDALSRVLLAAVVPLLLVLGAPFTLAMPAITSRTDQSRGVREWMQVIARARPVRLLMHPIVATCLFAVVLWATSATGTLRWTLVDPLAHELRVVALLVAGSVLVHSLISARQVRSRVLRVIIIASAILTPAVLGAWVVIQNGLIAANWFGAMGRTWGPDPLADQRTAGFVLATGAVGLVLAALFGHRQRTRKP
ncbi:cytochrome c oxidase assembly protein [Microbacterium tenebrionis]|uniref:cytochrome c oxidase assembly protein n=2 Tax=Microbacterium TaxID=33882 RepID=UPI00158E80A1|nr:cytochrome c oxidase assembly protein [Microbacterium ihumii]